MTSIIPIVALECDVSHAGFRPIVSIVLTLLLPAQLLGQDAASAMVYANGTAWVNGAEVPKSVALFSGDELQTKQDSSANISTNGSAIMVLSDSVVKYEGTSVAVDRGSVRISTGSGFFAHACEVKARPANNAPTQYQFTHNDGHVTVIATKADVIVDDHGESKTVAEGQQVTRDDGCALAEKEKKRIGPSAPYGLGSPTVRYVGIAVVGGIITWILWPHDHNHPEISPDCPDKTCPK